jgi:hypothetical protein
MLRKEQGPLPLIVESNFLLAYSLERNFSLIICHAYLENAKEMSKPHMNSLYLADKGIATLKCVCISSECSKKISTLAQY